jgi:hypothetical protein
MKQYPKPSEHYSKPEMAAYEKRKEQWEETQRHLKEADVLTEVLEWYMLREAKKTLN